MHLVTKKSLENLKLGRQKGTNHLLGISKSAKHKRNTARAIKKWCKENPDKVKERAKKWRAEKHYLWKGGESILNQSIRRMTENIYWQRGVKKIDGKCRLCESKEELEAHHIIPLKVLLKLFHIKNREDARNCPQLWDLSNGMTLCRKCHCKLDNRKYNKNGNGRRKTI